MNALSCALLVATLAAITPEAQKALTASKGWVKVPSAGETSAAAFAVVDNPTMYDVYLVSATSDVAGAIEFRAAGPDGKPIAAVEAAAYGRVDLKPDGVHMVLKNLKRPLKAGETVTITLTTDGGAALDVAAEVRATPPGLN